MNMDPQHRADVLARTELFQWTDLVTQPKLAEWASTKVYERGQTIYWQDDLGDRMFILAEGVVKLYVSSRNGDLVELTRYLPPASFGEAALLDGGPRIETAEAVERSIVLTITRADLLRLLRSEERVAEALMRTLGAIVRRSRAQLIDLAFLNLEGRVARQLLILASGGDWDHPRTRQVTQSELATMVSATRQRVNQALRSLEARGYIRSAGRVVEILDRERLQHLARR